MSAQLDMLCIEPERGTDCYEILMAMKRGVRMTHRLAVIEYDVCALSQRIGDLKRRFGWPIQTRTIETNGGARVSEYWL